ncbi:MAG: TIGR04282 family arsenosugar biosynthesis glycosyltransferase, partial [Planctomycetes bacterium]|nr:TIGR04282 family arsenosugar biosynthesis glycosyltransferase [Planctomycetota bacterium]
EREEAFRRWLGSGFRYLTQEGQSLGERLEYAFVHAYSLGFDRVIVIGSDSPDLPTSLLDRALRSLRCHDAVIGPCDDGGYYLIGFHVDSFCPSVFRHIEWSTGKVYDQTLRNLNQTGVDIQMLPQWQDVDSGRDLDQLVRRNANSRCAAPKTLHYCREQGWNRPDNRAQHACR